MKSKLIKIPLIILVLLGLLFPNFSLNLTNNLIQAEGEIVEELLPEEPLMPGRIEGVGTYFEIKDSEYLNISLKSTEGIKVVLESIPKMISLDIESSSTTSLTELTIEGLEPNKTYYKYQDSYKNEAVFISDEKGGIGWDQDLTKAHHIWIQEERGTVYIPNQCPTYGTWETTTLTCTLNQDLNQSLEITENNIALDCNGYNILGNKTGHGIYLNGKENVTIKNCNVNNFSGGVFLSYYSSNNTIMGNNFSNNFAGIALSSFSSANLITNNNISENKRGIELFKSSQNIISHNKISLNNWEGILFMYSRSNENLITRNDIYSNGHGPTPGYYPNVSGIHLFYASNNTILNNQIFNNLNGIWLWYSENSKVYQNNFLNNSQSQLYNYEGTGNIFDDGYPLGGNYWSDYGGIDEKSGPNQDQSGPDGIGDTPHILTSATYRFFPYSGWSSSPEIFISGQDRYPFMRESGWEVPLVLPDLFISEIRPVQVVWELDINDDGKIDLIAGKSTMIRLEIGLKYYQTLPKEEVIEVELTFDGKSHLATSTVKQLEENNNQIDFYPESPNILGNQMIVAEIDPWNEISEFKEGNNKKSVDITVKDTDRLYIGYTRILPSSGYADYGEPSIEDFQKIVTASGEFIEAVYPVAKSKFRNEINSKYPEYKGDPTHYLGMIEDILSLAVIKVRSGINRAVGIASDYYFTYHGLCGPCGCTKGVTHKWIPWAVLTEVGYFTTPAHEIGHTYGLHRNKEEYVFDLTQCKMLYHGNFASGFWVDRKEPIENSICFMGSAPPRYHFERWIDEEDYRKLFQTFRVNKDDPEILLLNGIIFKDGKVELGKSYYLPSEEFEYPISGDYSVQLIEQNGSTIQEISFGGPFEMLVEPLGVVETDFAPFVLTIPYTENTWKLQIQYKEETLIEINPNIELLHDTIDLIPGYGFINNPLQRRNTLHNKIGAVEKMVEKDNFKGAINKLKFDIKDKFEKWLIDSYEVENSLQLSKEEIIELVDEIIGRFNLLFQN